MPSASHLRSGAGAPAADNSMGNGGRPFLRTRVSTVRPSPQFWRRAIDFAELAAGLAGSWLIAATVAAPTARPWWAGVLFIYFVFYRRIAYVVYWARDTYRRVAPPGTASAETAGRRGEGLDPDDSDSGPRFHVLIAAYNAGSSIGPVIRALSRQNYPSSRYDAWIISSARETNEAEIASASLIASNKRARSIADLDASVIAAAWERESVACHDLESWVAAVTAGQLRPYLSGRGAAVLAVQDLLTRLLRARVSTECSDDVFEPLRLSKWDVRTILRTRDRISAEAARVVADFERLLGDASTYPLREVETQLIESASQSSRLRRVGQRLVRACRSADGADDAVPLRSVESVSRWFQTTQDRVREVIAEVGLRNIHHIESYSRAYKPGALNDGYREIRRRGLLVDSTNTYFIVIDADSLLPAHALRTVAAEIRKNRPSGIMQFASIPTANFFSSQWFSRFVSFTDAVGAVGKWARSTQRHLRPDLAAGSGVIVAAPLAMYIAEHQGTPWSETTITEDARLIIGQFGLAGGARYMTAMAPVYLLEAVPAARGFRRTYRSYWNQRRRWTIGGYNEFLYMLAVPDWVIRARLDRSEGRWRQTRTSRADRWFGTLRRIQRTAWWAWDHFWWGLGSMVILTHWSLVSLSIAEPSRPVFILGLSALLLLPIVFLLLVGRPLIRFIPGGLSFRTHVMLYFVAFPAMWLYAAPVACTQLICMFATRSGELDWRPTQKPQYETYVPTDGVSQLRSGRAGPVGIAGQV